jgi:hypothetical protein
MNLKINNNYNLGYNASKKAIIHIIVIPFIIFITTKYINDQNSLIGLLMYITFISLLQWYRAKKIPTYENIFRKNIFFGILAWLIIISISLIVMISLIIL